MIALDTNVLIYACDRSNRARQTQALDLIDQAVDGVLLWQVACEFIAASRKLSAQGFTAADAWERLAEFQALFPLVHPSAAVLTVRARVAVIPRGGVLGRDDPWRMSRRQSRDPLHGGFAGCVDCVAETDQPVRLRESTATAIDRWRCGVRLKSFLAFQSIPRCDSGSRETPPKEQRLVIHGDPQAALSKLLLRKKDPSHVPRAALPRVEANRRPTAQPKGRNLDAACRRRILHAGPVVLSVNT